MKEKEPTEEKETTDNGLEGPTIKSRPMDSSSSE